MSMDDMLYDAAVDAARSECDTLREELLSEIREVGGYVEEVGGRLERVENSLPTHDDLDAQIHRINELERDLEQVGDLHSDINALDRRLNEVSKRLTDLTFSSGLFDTASSASRQHYIDTGRYLTHAEVAEEGTVYDRDAFPETAEARAWAEPIRDDQRKMIFGLLKALGWDNNDCHARGQRLAAVNVALSRVQPYTSLTQLSEQDASTVIDAFVKAVDIREVLA